MDISVGKLIFQRIQRMFTQEDILTQKLKELKQAYDLRTALQIIPFYQTRLEVIRE